MVAGCSSAAFHIYLTGSKQRKARLLAVDRISGAPRPFGLVRRVQWLVYHLFSLETLLVMFVYGAHLKIIIPSPPLPETVFYGMLSMAVGLWIALRQGIYLRGVPIVAAGLAFSAWMVLSYGWSPPSVVAQERLIFVLGINIWAVFVAACIVAGSRERVLRFLLLLVLVSVVLTVIGTYIHFVHGEFRTYEGPDGDWPERTYLTWGNIIGTGTAISLGILIHTRFASAKQLLAAAICTTCVLFLLVGGSRGPLLSVMLGVVVALLINMPQFGDRRIEVSQAQLLGFLTIILIAGYIVYVLSIGEVPWTVQRFLRLFDQANDPLLRQGANRFDYYAGAYRAWLEAPFFGKGLGGFAVVFCGWDAPGCFPHNVLLQALSDFGLIGFALYLVFLFAALCHCRPAQLRNDPLRLALFMAFITVAVYGLVNVDLPTYHRLFFFLGLLALRRPPEEEEETVDVAERNHHS